MSKQDIWIICLISISFISELNFFYIEVRDLAHGMEAGGGGGGNHVILYKMGKQ